MSSSKDFRTAMQSETTNAETGLELPLAEPHFDDEATVLSARRVVPLDEVESYEAQTPSRFARGWVFAATVVGAMLLGVVLGAGYYSYAYRQPSQPLIDTENIVAGVDGTVTEPAGNRDASVPASEVKHTTPADADTEVEVKEAPGLSQPVVSSNETRKPVARRVDVLTSTSSHEQRKAAWRLAKQQKKELERESRDRNLMRIREIFEGPQRP
jgi:hypothetical protein